MRDPKGPTQGEAALVTGGLLGVAVVLLVQAPLSGVAIAVERALGIIAGLLMTLGVWWWARTR